MRGCIAGVGHHGGMADESVPGGFKLILVPVDSVEETPASKQAGMVYVAARHGGAERTIMGPFEVVADVAADRKITMSRVFFEQQVEVVG